MKAFIKEESLNALENLCSNCYFYSSATIQILIDEVGSKSLAQSENSFNSIIKMIENWSKEDIFSGTNYCQWEAICKHIILLYAMKREPYSKRACRIMDAIYSKFGEEDFHTVMRNFTLDGTSKNNLMIMIKSAQDTKQKAKPSESFRDIISKNKFSK
jgi:bisphosphoglycerate-dependent phosphoglycerate mutase